jgi:threonine 3-dehydrogenase
MQMKRMQALVKTTPENAELQTITVPEPAENQVVVRVKAAALCGTDLHVYNWNMWARNAGIKLPLVMGHECCGDIAEVGQNVRGLQVGDKIAVETHVPCGKCYQCLNGEQHICNDLKLFSIHMNGCFAEYAVVPSVCARKIPTAIPYHFGAVMEPLGTSFRSVVETQVMGANVVVIGCGPIGLFTIASAITLGAAKVIATDVSHLRLKIAAEMGADMTLSPGRDNVVKTVLELTGQYGADVIIDASGSVDAIGQSFKYLRKGGRIALIGLPDKPLELEIGKEVVFKEATIIGIHGRKMFETWIRMENLLAAGKLNIQPAITHVLPLTQWKEGIDLALSGEACKVVYEP